MCHSLFHNSLFLCFPRKCLTAEKFLRFATSMKISSGKIRYELYEGKVKLRDFSHLSISSTDATIVSYMKQ